MDLIEKKIDTRRHPWEISRTESILKIIKRNSPDMQYADIGAGDIFFTKELTKYTNKPIYAVDINYRFLDDTNKIILVKEVSDILKNSIDCIILMDILEHIKDDILFLRDSLKILKSKGEAIITVPAHHFLFSPHDIFLKHYRRYDKKQLCELLEKVNLEIKEIFYFYTLPFIIRFLQVILVKLNFSINMNKGIGKWKLGENNIITISIKNILDIDFFINRFLNKYRIVLPGLSLCVICQKKFV